MDSPALRSVAAILAFRESLRRHLWAPYPKPNWDPFEVQNYCNERTDLIHFVSAWEFADARPEEILEWPPRSPWTGEAA